MGEKILGRITDTFLGREDHGIFTFGLTIDFGSATQVLGTYCLSYNPNGEETHYHPLIGEAIDKICTAVGVRCWEELKGKIVFVERDPDTKMLDSIEAPPFVRHGPAYNIKEHLGSIEEY